MTEIVKKTKTALDPTKLGEHWYSQRLLRSIETPLIARILRILATYHIFREISPDVFANNRISTMLDKGKSLKDILEQYVHYHNVSRSHADALIVLRRPLMSLRIVRPLQTFCACSLS